MTNFGNRGQISGCQGLVTGGRQDGGGCGYKKATGAILLCVWGEGGVVHILTVDAGTNSWDEIV